MTPLLSRLPGWLTPPQLLSHSTQNLRFVQIFGLNFLHMKVMIFANFRRQYAQVGCLYRVDAILCVVDAKHIQQHLDDVREEGVVNEAVQQVRN